MRLWVYGDSHIDDDNTLAMTIDEIDELVGIDGFGKALPVEWLQVLDADRVQLPDFLAHNGGSEKQRRDNARRQAEYRHRRDSRNVTRDVTESNASNDARPDQKRLDKTRPEKRAEAAPPRAAVEDEHAESFALLKSIYPKRSGDQKWHDARKAINARLAEGHTWAEILDGAHRYADWCKATGKLNTETVKQAATFCGPGKPFLDDWTPPATKADVRLAGNLDAAAEFMRRTEFVQ